MEIAEILQNTQWGEALLTLAVAMLPILELRGAIPFGVALGLNPWMAMLAAMVGNLIPAPFIILFVRKVFAFLRAYFPRLDGFVTKLEDKAHLKGQKVKKYKYLGLFLFVAVPLPGTGAWTGSLVAVFLNMSLRKAMPSIALGILVAGFLITGLTFGFTAIFA